MRFVLVEAFYCFPPFFTSRLCQVSKIRSASVELALHDMMYLDLSFRSVAKSHQLQLEFFFHTNRIQILQRLITRLAWRHAA